MQKEPLEHPVNILVLDKIRTSLKKAWNDNRYISFEAASEALKEALTKENFKVVKLERIEKTSIAVFYVESTEG